MTAKFSVHFRGVGPLYFATETKCSERAHLSRAWITEMAPPYRKGKGVRLRLGRYAVQVGICHKNDVDETEDVEGLLDHVGWRSLDTSVDEILLWSPEWKECPTSGVPAERCGPMTAACPTCDFSFSTMMDEPIVPRHWWNVDGITVKVTAP